MFEATKKKISNKIIGNDDKIEMSLACIISGGHILIEDLPGTGKTTFAKALTKALNLEFKRIQFTSDLLPSDIIGYNINKDNQLEFQKGPLFSNIILADELNRSSPKTQSAFMEAMEEKNVTVDRETYPLPDPFIIIATQNPSDLAGTSLLPESQLDRFMISFSLNELNDVDQLKVLKEHKESDNQKNQEFFDLKKLNLQKKEIIMEDVVFNYILNISKYMKENFNEIHISSRCLKFIVNMSKSLTLIRGSKAVTFKEVQEVVPYVLRHRIELVDRKEVNNFIQKKIIEKVDLPK
jgi:MoxR-like ATPase